MALTVCQEIAAKANASMPSRKRAVRQTPRSRRLRWSRSWRAEGDSAEASAGGVESVFIAKLCWKAPPVRRETWGCLAKKLWRERRYEATQDKGGIAKLLTPVVEDARVGCSTSELSLNNNYKIIGRPFRLFTSRTF